MSASSADTTHRTVETHPMLSHDDGMTYWVLPEHGRPHLQAHEDPALQRKPSTRSWISFFFFFIWWNLQEQWDWFFIWFLIFPLVISVPRAKSWRKFVLLVLILFKHTDVFSTEQNVIYLQETAELYNPILPHLLYGTISFATIFWQNLSGALLSSLPLALK